MLLARRASFALAVLLSVVVLFAPGDDVPSAPYVDKLVHAALFAALALTGRWAGVPVGPLVGALLCYAVASELVQGWVGALNRSGSVADGLADVLGVAVGTALARLTRLTDRRGRPATW